MEVSSIYRIKNVVDNCIVEILRRPAKHFADKTSKYSQRCQPMKIQNLKTVSYRTPLPPIGSLSKDDGDGKEKKKSSRFRAFLHGVGDPGLAGGGGVV